MNLDVNNMSVEDAQFLLNAIFSNQARKAANDSAWVEITRHALNKRPRSGLILMGESRAFKRKQQGVVNNG